MHRGNIFVSRSPPLRAASTLQLISGIVGSLTPQEFRTTWRRNRVMPSSKPRLTGAWPQTAHRFRLGLPCREKRVSMKFEAAIRSVCEPIFEGGGRRPLKDISFGQLLLRLLTRRPGASIWKQSAAATVLLQNPA